MDGHAVVGRNSIRSRGTPDMAQLTGNTASDVVTSGDGKLSHREAVAQANLGAAKSGCNG